jgi:hypothetical protein
MSHPIQQSGAIARHLHAEWQALGLNPQAQSELADDACAWLIDLGHGLQAEFALQRTSWDDHQLTLVTASDCAHDPQHWPALDLFAHQMTDLAAPGRLVRYEAELGLAVQGRALGAPALAELGAELVFLQRRAVTVLLEPWVMLARGACSLDEASLRVGATVSQQQTRASSGEGA